LIKNCLSFNFFWYSDNRLPCSLWGKFADQIHKVSKESVGGIVICLIRWAKLGHYKGITFP